MAEGTPDAELLTKLREAVAAVGSGGETPLVDRELEARLAPLAKKATRLIGHRDRSVEELRHRLSESLEDGEDPRLVTMIIDRCLANGMLNDERFANEWVRQRHRNQRKSVSILRRELKTKGLAPRIIEDALKQISEDDQQEILSELVKKKAGTLRNIPSNRAEQDKALRRIVGVAARRGFPPGLSLVAARRALAERISELGG